MHVLCSRLSQCTVHQHSVMKYHRRAWQRGYKRHHNDDNDDDNNEDNEASRGSSGDVKQTLLQSPLIHTAGPAGLNPGHNPPSDIGISPPRNPSTILTLMYFSRSCILQCKRFHLFIHTSCAVAWSVCLSVCRLSHSCILVKLLDRFKRHLADTLVRSSHTSDTVSAGSPSREDNIWGIEPSSWNLHLPTYDSPQGRINERFRVVTNYFSHSLGIFFYTCNWES